MAVRGLVRRPASCQRDALPGPKVPKFVRLTEALPKNPSGKILKRELREIYRDMAEERPDDRGVHI
ncbi:hypothetical protein V2J94_02530 [Streptomyces sp. DSM 41524]|uniref:AMP-binding enzyme C-terminal domain-containing protein n=1 Tax=Streptomyces asiaticus subsp. ignotus TaxID=3098222 RepID=A0ABU7PNY5_9ACTN|nr:hypothetical protein [Streptomyces sp. DSM 41524]